MMAEAPNVHPLLREADRLADAARAEYLSGVLQDLQDQIDALQAENTRLKAAATAAGKK